MTELLSADLKHRLKFIGLILVFVSPFVAGWMALYVFKLHPASNQYGDLVQPVKPLILPAVQALDGKKRSPDFWKKWTFVVIANDGCQQLCQKNIYYLRQMRIALGRDIERVQNVLLTPQKVASALKQKLKEYPALTVIENAPPELSRLFDLPGHVPGRSPMLYLIDPTGNLMMTYPAQNKPRSILHDIQRLLKNSQIG